MTLSPAPSSGRSIIVDPRDRRAPAAQSDVSAAARWRRDAPARVGPRQARPLFERALGAARETASEPEIARACSVSARSRAQQGRADEARPGDRGARHFRAARRSACASPTPPTCSRGSSGPAANRAAASRPRERALATYEGLEHRRGIALAGVQLATRMGSRCRRGRAACSSGGRRCARRRRRRSLEGEALHTFGDRLFDVGRYEESLELLSRAAARLKPQRARRPRHGLQQHRTGLSRPRPAR